MRLVLSLALVALWLAQPVRAQGLFLFPPVNPLPEPGAFEVVGPRTSDARLVWCTAARYAQSKLGAGFSTRIYVVAPRGDSRTDPGQKAVGFTVLPDAAMAAAPKPETGYSLAATLRARGYYMALSHADQHCSSILEDMLDDPMRPWWWP